MTDRERIARIPVETHKYKGKRYLTLNSIDQILTLCEEAGYTRQPEPVLTRISDEELNGMKLLLNFGSHHKDDIAKLLNAQLAHTKKELGIKG